VTYDIAIVGYGPTGATLANLLGMQGLEVAVIERDRTVQEIHISRSEPQTIAAEALRYRRDTHRGEAIGRIRIPRMHLNMVLVDGTDHDTLKQGPGRDLRTFMPGENRLIYIAGHRTTYLAPFSHIDSLRPGDKVTIEVPYGTFVYSVTGHRIVAATDLSVLRSPRHERLELQACHPRFFASHRYIAYARLVHVEPRGGTPFDLAAAGAADQPSRK